MGLDLCQTEEHRMLAQSLGRMLTDAGGWEIRAKRLKPEAADRLSLWPALIELGALAALTPEKAGGFGGGPADMGAVIAATARFLSVEPLLVSGVVCGRLLDAAGPAFDDVHAAAQAGEAVFALATTEGFDAFTAPAASATPVAEGWRLDGFKPAVRHADVATHLIVSAVYDGETGLFLVPLDAPGVHRTETRLIDAAGAADVRLDHAVVGSMAKLELPDAEAALHDALEWALAGLVVETAALLQVVVEDTVAYLKTRHQFGQPLAAFQALQHALADMVIASEEAAAVAALTLEALEAPSDPARSAVLLGASLTADRAGRLCAHKSLQLFGGMGVSDETPISHYARRLAAIRVQLGGEDARADRLSRIQERAQ